MEKSLALYQDMNLAETLTLAETLAKSGFFKDSKSTAQAVVKILAGREMGIGPIASMAGINVIKGKVAIGASIMASAVRGDPRYDFRVIKITNQVCEIAFYQNGKEIGRSRFTIQDAQAAEIGTMIAPGASKSMLARFTRNMLYSRAMSNGMRWYCPDAAGGAPIYSPEELGARVDGDGDVIEGVATIVREPPEPTKPEATETTTTNGNGPNEPEPHWIEDEKRRVAFWAWAGGKGLDSEAVHNALNVEHVEEFTGTAGQAKTLVVEWIKAGQELAAKDAKAREAANRDAANAALFNPEEIPE